MLAKVGVKLGRSKRSGTAMDLVAQLKAIVPWDTLLLGEDYSTTTRVWTNRGDLAVNAVADGSFASPDSITTNWSNGHTAVNFNNKTLTLGTYPLYSALTSSIVVGEFTTEIGAVLYNNTYKGLEFSGGRLGYQGINSFIGADRNYIGKKFISAFGNKAAPSYSTITSLLFQNGDSNRYGTGGAFELNKANIGGRPSQTGNMNGKIAFVGKTTGTPTPAQFVAIMNLLDTYYNVLDDSKYVMFEGDSIMNGVKATQYTASPTVIIESLGASHNEVIRYCDMTQSGNRWSYVEGGATPTSDSLTTPFMSINRYSNANKVCVIWLGTNDFVGGVTASTALAQTIQYINKRIANGCTKFVVCPTIARNGISGSMLTQATAYNLSLSTLTVQGATIKYAPLDQDSRLMTYTDTRYFDIDGIHLITAGQAVSAGIIAPKIEEFFWP